MEALVLFLIAAFTNVHKSLLREGVYVLSFLFLIKGIFKPTGDYILHQRLLRMSADDYCWLLRK